MLRSWKKDNTEEDGQYFVWGVDGKPVSVHLSAKAAHELEEIATSSDHTEGVDRVPERGGVLLGRVSEVNSEQYIVAVERIELVPCEHQRGPSYILGSREKDELFRRIRRHAKAKNGCEVVGFFRLHTRPGLYLDQYDFDLMRGYFAHPSSVALLIRPSTETIPTAGFFFWEDGDIQRSSSYREFPLGTGAPRPKAPVAPVMQVPDPTPAPAAFAPFAAATIDSSPSREIPADVNSFDDPGSIAPHSPLSTPISVPAPMPAPPAASPKVTTPAASRPHVAAESKTADRDDDPEQTHGRRGTMLNSIRGRKAFPAIAAGVLAVLALAWWASSNNTHSSGNNQFSLRAEALSDGLRLKWDQNSPALRDADDAVVWISDGGQQKRIYLNRDLLRNGSIMYWPNSDDVNFRFEAKNHSESLRAVAPKLPGSKNEPASYARARTQEYPEAVPVESMRRNEASPERRSDQQEEPRRVLNLPSVTPAQAQAEAEMATLPDNIKTEQPKLDKPAVLREPARPRPATDVKTERASPLRRIAGVIPGLFRGKKNDNFTPAKAVRQVSPNVPDSISIDNETRVSVRVSLDERGHVRGTDLMTKSVDSRLANAAMEAAKRWRFEPARVQDKAVASSVIVNFHFGRDAT